MKKITIIALLAIIMIISTVLNVHAVDEPTDEVDNSTSWGELIVTPSSTTAKVGDTITIILSVKSDTEIEGLTAFLAWDDTQLELINKDNLVAASGYVSISGFDEETKKFELVIFDNDDSKVFTEGDLVKLTFKVLDGAAEKEKLSVALSEIELGDSNENWLEIDNRLVELSIEQNEPEPETNQNQTPAPEQDNTIADKTINKAGLSNYAFVIVLGAIVAVALYAKCKSFKDVK